MNVNTLAEKLNTVRDDLQQRWSKLTEAELEQVKGDLGQLVDTLDDTRHDAQRQANRFVKQYDRRVQDVAARIPKPVRRQIARYPGAALVSALIVVFFAGLLLRR